MSPEGILRRPDARCFRTQRDGCRTPVRLSPGASLPASVSSSSFERKGLRWESWTEFILCC